MITTEELLDFANEVAVLTTHVQTSFGNLSDAQLNWKPHADKWSIAQCLHHIITSNTTYFPVFDAVKSGRYAPTLWQRVPIVPAFIGREMVKALGRVPRRAIKTSPMFEPTKSMISREIIAGFALHQFRVAEYLRFFAQSNLHPNHIIIPLPITPLLIVPLSDALTVMVNHEFRHVRQAENVAKSVNFGIL